jgi:hypothetical protein
MSLVLRILGGLIIVNNQGGQIHAKELYQLTCPS